MKHAHGARARELAARLTTYRDKTGWSQQQFAQRLNWPTQKCVQIETGQWSPSELDVAMYLAECGVPPLDRAALLELVDGDRHGCWVRPHGDRLPDAAPGVLFQHQTAEQITCYHPTEIPVILQDNGYINEDLRHRFGTDEAIARHEFPRCEYRWILHSDTPPEVTCFLHESVLRAVPFDEDDRWELYNDLTVYIESKQTEVRIIPADREDALRVPEFSLLRSAGRSPVVCRPCETVTLILEGDHIAAYEPYVALLDELALSTLESRDLIVEIAGGQEAIAFPPTSTIEDLARDGEVWEPGFITEAMAAVQAKREAEAQESKAESK